MWSGQSSDCVGDPLKARVNLAAVSKSTINRRTASSDFTDTPSIQTPAINVLKETNPGGRYWIKLDGTDVKEGLQHSMKEKWDGDVDMLDGQLSKLQEEYRLRLKSVALSDYTDCAIPLEEILSDLSCDKTFLEKIFTEASRNLRSKISQENTSAETLKTLNWDVVECNTLLQQCQGFVDKFDNAEDIPALLKCLTDDLHLYFKNLYKKKRTAVIM
ncbi:uncharacterized protein LOC134231905 [Saccostrea cucullata]|uniref:uncharacterized protein LOC134231905 n=1 Tax=Saccostrea cuccullata TaxID=36930 RepID=UPI002ED1B0CC